ncbi:hypothetical protein D9758_015835 [Tetrapyrgos nigripes]|uniref:Uncharacterized protein n=1 Tax=Tetrapyrgos nigripes TaxID=182062 RepID=A0A8H5CEW9_9AGAR|nr:hypothetical protein D9758_015835 [Tetrapyrgos nigripes]
MGMAIPVEGTNRYYVLMFYGVVFGGVLPGMPVGRWFGSRQETKDSINATSTAVFFKGFEEGEDGEDVVGVLSGAYKYEMPSAQKGKCKGGSGVGKDKDKFVGTKEGGKGTREAGGD